MDKYWRRCRHFLLSINAAFSGRRRLKVEYSIKVVIYTFEFRKLRELVVNEMAEEEAVVEN